MTDNVIKLYPHGEAVDPDNVLKHAVGEYKEVFIVGYDHDGNLDMRASTNISERDVLWLIEQAKLFVLDLGEED